MGLLRAFERRRAQVNKGYRKQLGKVNDQAKTEVQKSLDYENIYETERARLREKLENALVRTQDPNDKARFYRAYLKALMKIREKTNDMVPGLAQEMQEAEDMRRRRRQNKLPPAPDQEALPPGEDLPALPPGEELLALPPPKKK